MPGSGSDPLAPLTGPLLGVIPLIVVLMLVLFMVYILLVGADERARLREFMKEFVELRKRKRSGSMAKWAAVGAVLVVVGIVMAGIFVLSVFQYKNAEYQYRHAIGAYIDNANDAPNFEVMQANLISAYDGMRNESLVSSDCARAWSWEQTQDQCMGYQYVYVEGLINRTEFYLERVRSGNISQFSDVYEQMISNMRAEMGRNGPVDWVAWPAWLLKYHPEFYWNWYVVELLVAIFVFVAAVISFVVWE